jgi:hypothetical protein
MRNPVNNTLVLPERQPERLLTGNKKVK